MCDERVGIDDVILRQHGAEGGLIPGGSQRNLGLSLERLEVASTDELSVLLLADPQTSGALLFGGDGGPP